MVLLTVDLYIDAHDRFADQLLARKLCFIMDKQHVLRQLLMVMRPHTNEKA